MGVLSRSLIKDLIQQTFNLKEEVAATLMTCRVLVSVQLKLQEVENNSNSSNLKDNHIQ
jgi:hypothetical protein